MIFSLQIRSRLFRLNLYRTGQPKEYKENYGYKNKLYAKSPLIKQLGIVNKTHAYAELSNLSNLNQNSYNNFSYVQDASPLFSKLPPYSFSTLQHHHARTKKKEIRNFFQTPQFPVFPHHNIASYFLQQMHFILLYITKHSLLSQKNNDTPNNSSIISLADQIFWVLI